MVHSQGSTAMRKYRETRRKRVSLEIVLIRQQKECSRTRMGASLVYDMSASEPEGQAVGFEIKAWCGECGSV